MNILISGAGIAGLTLAYWLKKYGYNPTVIEKHPSLRNEGYMMDFFSSGFDVAEAMDIIGDIEAKDHNIKELIFLNAKSKRIGSFRRDQIKEVLYEKYASILRGELEDILHQKIKDNVEVRFGTSIKELEQSENEVNITYEDGKKESYDLVIGADGIHSNVRKLAFGPEEKFAHYLGYYVVAFVCPDTINVGNNFSTYTEVDRMVGAYATGKGDIATFFVFKSPHLGRPNEQQQKKIVKNAFKGCPSIVPQLLKDMESADELFFDEVTQIKMDSWSKGRVSMVGDANACVTLLAGQGASMAMTESYILAKELKKADGNYAEAFKNYEKVLKPIVESKQKDAEAFTSSFTPKSKLALFIYSIVVRFIHWPFVLKQILSGFDTSNIFDEKYPI